MGPRAFLTVLNFFGIIVLHSVGRLLGGSMVGLTATSSKRATPIVCCTPSPCPCGRPLLTHTSAGDTQTLKGRSGSVSAGSLGPGAHKVLFEPSESLWRVWGWILNMISPLLPSCWGFSFALGCGMSFFGGLQHSPVDGNSAVGCNSGVFTGEDEHTSFYSTILRVISRCTCPSQTPNLSFPLTFPHQIIIY